MGSQKIEKHLCDQHAAEEGIAIKAVQPPINELLTNFVKLHASDEPESDNPQATSGNPLSGSECEQCGMTFSLFREKSLLGCPNCYKVFERQISSLLERAHEGGTYHIGKVPVRAGADEHRQTQLLHLRKKLDDAVASEDYELAARLRDDIKTFEESPE
ncbi:UvrB/UvrC motif-containing protein [Poriferisphaera sp. WC338]|uniref:UvrB/UvrC motif-containing protein n=1 Tax=Poriferisphaera sp. WC338 TaxID=3425129 RepID=UPI003D81301A